VKHGLNTKATEGNCWATEGRVKSREQDKKWRVRMWCIRVRMTIVRHERKLCDCGCSAVCRHVHNELQPLHGTGKRRTLGITRKWSAARLDKGCFSEITCQSVFNRRAAARRHPMPAATCATSANLKSRVKHTRYDDARDDSSMRELAGATYHRPISCHRSTRG
jgi:hypothetical protein